MNESSTSSQPAKPDNREKQLDSLRLQLRSPQPSSVKAGMDQVRKWLQDDPEDRDVLRLLMDAAKEIPNLRDDVRNIVQGFAEKGSAAANGVLQEIDTLNKQPPSPEARLPDAMQENQPSPTVQDLLRQADDEYYAAQYDRATSLYRQILQLEPNNLRARQQLDKAELNKITGIPNPNLPREAIQYYKQARSYIAAEDFITAENFVTRALEIAQEVGMRFPEAEAFLEITKNQMLAVEYRTKGNSAIQAENWEEALDLLKKTLKLDPTDESTKKLRDGVQGLLKAEALLDPFSIQLDDRERKNKVQAISSILRETEGTKELVSAQRYKILLARHNLYKAETDLPESWILKFLSLHNNIKKAQKSARYVLKGDDSALQFIESQMAAQRPFRIALLFLIFAILLGAVAAFWRPIPPSIPQTVTATPPLPLTQAPTFTLTMPIVNGLTLTLSPQPTETWPPIASSPTLALTLGYVKVSACSAVDTIDIPNGKVVARLPRNQVVKILERRTAFTIDYFLCAWDADGGTLQGWIPVEYIKFGNPPMTSTITP